MALRRADPASDLDLVWRWWEAPHVQSYWSFEVRLGPKPQSGNYSAEHLRAYWSSKTSAPEDFVPLIVEVDGVPAAYLEDYRVAASPLAGNPLLSEDDRGFHAMIGNLDFRGIGLSHVVGEAIMAWQRRTYPLCRRIVMEPSAANKAAIRAALKLPGAKRYADVQLPHKKSALIIVDPESSKTAKIGIVGMGAVGTTAAIQLIHRIVSLRQKNAGLSSEYEIHCFEEKNELGRGLAYSTPKDFHIMNMRASTMSLDPERPTDFLEWLAQRSEERSADLDYVPRRLFGSYLNERWREALDLAKEYGIRVSVHKESVTDCHETRRGVNLSSATQKMILDTVILCLGHLPRKLSAAKFGGLERYIECPFDFKRIESIPPHASVGIIGTSLTAVDVIFTLKASGFSGDIHCFARKRHLPKVQSSAKPVTLQFLNKEKLRVLTNDFKEAIWLEHIFVLLEKDFAEISDGKKLSHNMFFSHREDIFAHKVPNTVSVVEESLSLVSDGQPTWHTILDSTSEVISLIWNQLDIDDKKRFQKRIESIWTMYRHSMPQANAKRLLSIAQTGCLKVHTGLTASDFDDERQQFGLVVERMEGGSDGASQTKWVDFLIDATGTESRLGQIRSELLDNMLTRGQMSPHALGGVDVDFATSRLVSREGKPSARLYFVGQLTKGVHFYTNSYEMNRNNVRAVIDDVVKEASQ